MFDIQKTYGTIRKNRKFRMKDVNEGEEDAKGCKKSPNVNLNIQSTLRNIQFYGEQSSANCHQQMVTPNVCEGSVCSALSRGESTPLVSKYPLIHSSSFLIVQISIDAQFNQL
jgi:hypothetical protein